MKELINKLKEIRINNIIIDSSKEKLKEISLNWSEINDYLIDEKYKIVAGLLINSKLVAASSDGIIITLEEEINIKRIEQNYDLSKELITKICGKKYKIVFISNNYWSKERPKYITKYKNKELKKESEEGLLNSIKNMNNNSMNEFNELIEME